MFPIILLLKYLLLKNMLYRPTFRLVQLPEQQPRTKPWLNMPTNTHTLEQLLLSTEQDSHQFISTLPNYRLINNTKTRLDTLVHLAATTNHMKPNTKEPTPDLHSQ